MAWYTTGTITATNNSGAITGVGTLFMANVRIGDGVTIAGSTSIHEVVNVTSDTQLTVSPVYTGTTGSGKTYGVVPVQGYTKDLADQTKSLLLSFSTIGSSATVAALAGITGAADRLPYFTSGTAMATTAFTPAARTLLDDTTVAAMRTTLGLKTASVADILGTVSQTSGVPTGAVMEQGTNANGTYIKFAGGTLICYGTFPLFNVGAGAIATATPTVTFPATFIDVNITALMHGAPTLSGDVYGFTYNAWLTTTQFNMAYRNGSTAQQVTNGRWSAIGRWF